MSEQLRYIKPYGDLVVKYILGREANKELLLSFINAVLAGPNRPPIVEITIVSPFNLAEFEGDKESILDIKARDSDGKIIQIEVQGDAGAVFGNRLLYYWAGSYAAQLEAGASYNALKPVVVIGLLDFILFPDSSKHRTRFSILDEDEPRFKLTSHLEINVLELPKFRKIYNPPRSDLDRWLSYFCEEGKEDANMDNLMRDLPILQRAHEEYLKFIADEQLRSVYESREKARKDTATRLIDARMEGLKEGMEKGREEGMEKGREEGLKKAVDRLILQGFEESEARRILGL